MTDTQKQPAELPDDVLWEWFKESLKKRNLHDFDFCVLRDVADKAAAYGREQAQQWISVADEMPKSNKPVFNFYRNVLSKSRTVVGFYCGHHERSTENYGDFDEGGDWSDDGEVKYWPAGWYECVENWDDYSAVAIYEGVPTHWMPLPEPPTC